MLSCLPGHLAPQFSSDLLHLILPAPAQPNWMGALCAKLAKQGKLREVGRVVSKRKSCNGRKVTLWERV